MRYSLITKHGIEVWLESGANGIKDKFSEITNDSHLLGDKVQKRGSS